MKIEVIKIYGDDKVTLSRVLVDGVFSCFALEDPIRETKIYSQTAIPRGVYKVGTRHSPKFSGKFGHDMLWVKDVPNYEYILIHWGNTVKDTSGCLIVGNSIGWMSGQFAVLNSVSTYQNFYKQVIGEAKKGNLTIEYK